MKRTITVCDICEENETEKGDKCPFCGKDVCEDCMSTLSFSTMNGDEFLEIDLCEDCEAHMDKMKSQDKRDIGKKVLDILEPYLKVSICLDGLKTKKKDN